MPLVPYDPFQMMRREFGSLPRLFDDEWFETPWHRMPHVRVDVRETASEVVVSAEIPGLAKKDDVQITVHDNHLHLTGKVERSAEQAGENVHRTERFYGQFSRTVPLPADVDDSSAKATYHNGVLEVRLQKTERRSGHRIDVEFH
ncbi:MAG: Hsp20/alpha crystallin family protein [Alicyclobacillus sp.]|nr:Hsp20/alpha crystallin family protein [Alicyclobacillus sp.]